MRVTICGENTSIAREFLKLESDACEIHCARLETASHEHDAYLLCAGHLCGSALSDLCEEDIAKTFAANFIEVVRLCDAILAANDRARICVIGSESGISGSFDMAYAGSKAALHLYIETKELRTANQMLVAIAPHIIIDGGMTERRDDLAETVQRGRTTRMARWIEAREVAEVARFLLYGASPTLSNQVIRMRT